MKEKPKISAYAEKLKDPRWQKMRLRVFERDKWSCRACENTSKTLAVHHLYYERGREPWDYPMEAFMTLCEECHQAETDERRAKEADLLDALRRRGILGSDLDYLREGIAHPVLPISGFLLSALVCAVLQDEETLVYLLENQRAIFDRAIAKSKQQSDNS